MSVPVHCTRNIVGASLPWAPHRRGFCSLFPKRIDDGANRGTPLQIKTPVCHVAKSYKHAAPPGQGR
jgi:hypothetical protein